MILDSLLLSSLEVVDPNPVFLSNGEIIKNPETLAYGGEKREAAAADGITKVLLRSKVHGPGVVEFCLSGGNAPEDGGLAPLSNSGRANCVTTTAKETTKGFMAFAIYQTPDEFNRVGDEALAERSLGFAARFTPLVGSGVESTIPFKLVRPPVVLVHGIWSDKTTWTKFPLVKDARFKLATGLPMLADYGGSNASSFATNRNIPSLFIKKALTEGVP